MLTIRTCQVHKLMLNSHGEVILGVNDDIRQFQLPTLAGSLYPPCALSIFFTQLGLLINIRLRTGVLEMTAPHRIGKANH